MYITIHLNDLIFNLIASIDTDIIINMISPSPTYFLYIYINIDTIRLKKNWFPIHPTSPPPRIRSRLAIILPHIILRLPFAVLQAFLAPFRLFPAMLWLWWFADVDAVERAAVCGRRSGLHREATFRHVLKVCASRSSFASFV